MPNRSGSKKRKIRNQKKEQSLTTGAVETNEASTSKLEESKKGDEVEWGETKVVEDSIFTRCEEGEDVCNATSLDGRSNTNESNEEKETLPIKKAKKKKKKKKKEEGNDDAYDIDANNDLVIPSKGSMSDLRGDNPENGKEKEESKERNMTNETLEGTSTTDENILEIPSVVCDELTIEDDGKNKHRYGELSCATDLTTEKTSDINTAIDFVDGFQSKITDEELNETPHKSPPRGVKIPSEDSSWNDFRDLCHDDEPQEVAEERNFDCIVRVLIGIGASCLRQCFLDIHPKWCNQPKDATALKKGALKLLNHEKQKFCSGNIEDWDVSLLVRVLLFSAVSSVHLKLYPEKNDAICKIQEIRNRVVAHATKKKISKVDFRNYWELLKVNLMTLGATEEEIDSTLSDYSTLNAEQYRHLYLEELCLRKFSGQKEEKVKERNNQNVEKIPNESTSTSWDTWQKFREHANSFKSSQTHYILLADSMEQNDVQNFKSLSVIPWKMVLDFNPSSEDEGLYKAFNSQGTLQRTLSPITPGQIKKIGFSNLPKQIDSKRTQWLFVNGRKEDTDDCKPKSFPEWEQKSVKHIATFFSCCSQGEKFDNQKSITCLLLPTSKNSAPYVEVTLKRFAENFSDFNLNFACIDDSYKRMSGFPHIQVFPMSSQQLKDGIECLFKVSNNPEKYKMPTFHGEVFVPFSTREYVYMSENVELLYAGCETETINLDGDEKEREKDEEEHRRSFLSGNLISSASLYFNHDAKREIEKDIEIHIQRLLDQSLKHSVTVRIAHSPGTGGSTIGRRVLWNLHNSFPCAIIKLPNQSEFDEDSNFINELCERISVLEDKCGIPGVILLDGHRHWRIQGLSNRIVRTLNSHGKRAVILECQHGSKPANLPVVHPSAHIHKVFYVDVRLEESPSDLQEFMVKYNASNHSARRVFHFPLLSMMEEFRDRLVLIVSQTLDALDDVEKDIAAFVAFLQLYAGQSTPALLLYEAFKLRLEVSGGSQVTYDSIKNCFSGNLLNLMVYENKRKREGECFNQYTLQHRMVARLVFDKYLKDTKRKLYTFVSEFLDCGVSSVEKFMSLYRDLFLFNKEGNRNLRFSLVIETLKTINQNEAAAVFCKAAKRIPDPPIYGHAARFHAKMYPPNFEKAKDLIADGLRLSQSKGKAKSIQDSKGIVLSIELKHLIQKKKVKSIQKLEQLAERAITAFHVARDFPPSFYSPLIGEVEVWLSCIEWIVGNHCSGDKEEAVKFLTTQAPSFFRTCIGDCFNLLDIVDDIVMSSTSMSDPDESRDHALRVRINFESAIKPKPNSTRSPRREIDDLCLHLASIKTLSPYSQKEIKRFRARSLLSLFRREPQSFKSDDLKHLVKLLEEMVLIEKDYSFARHFLQLCPQITGPGNYSLEQGWKVCCEWSQVSDCYDPMRYYYSMVIAFMQILNGHGPSGYFAKYKSLVQKLKDASRGHCRRNVSFHYIGKGIDGMSKLISYQSLLSGETSYRADDSKIVKSFWTIESRRKLKECTGRLRVKVQGSREITTIELLVGDIELYVGKSADVGKPGKDFDKDAKVYFVVSFNLTGPVANGISFHPVEARTDA